MLEARRCTPAVDAGAEVERDSLALLDALLSAAGALRALSAISSGSDCDGSTIALSSAGASGSTLGAVRRGAVTSARPLGSFGVPPRDGFVDSTIEPTMVLASDEGAPSLVPAVNEPSGRACTGVMSRARSEAALASTSAKAAASAIFFAAATATGSASESRLRLRVTSGISAGATGSSLATGAGASSGGTGTPLRVTWACGGFTMAGAGLEASLAAAGGRALNSARGACVAALAASDFVGALEITLDWPSRRRTRWSAIGEADEFVTSFMIADTVVSESSDDSVFAPGAPVEFAELATGLRSCGRPIVRFTER